MADEIDTSVDADEFDNAAPAGLPMVGPEA